MINSKTERKAIHLTALVFNEMGWLFREQPLMDFGIDATVEIAFEGRPQGKFIALQIKGGDSNFIKTKTGFKFYFDNNHKDYWFLVGKTFPVLLILHDPSSNQLYWREIKNDSIEKTIKKWKIEIPLINHLSSTCKDRISLIIDSHYKSPTYTNKYHYLLNFSNKENSEVKFENIKEIGIQCIITTGEIQIKFPLMYVPKKDEWDIPRNNFSFDSVHTFTFQNLKNLLLSEIQNNTSLPSQENLHILIDLIEKIKQTAKNNSIIGIEEFLFDLGNKGNNVPKLSKFIEAFKSYIKFKDIKYEILPLEYSIVIITEENEYDIDTDEGRISLLTSIIESKSYEDIAAITDPDIWNQIYLDPEIEKETFMHVLKGLWEEYWDELYKKTEIEFGHVTHLDPLKASSRENLLKFQDGYDNTPNIIDYASDIDYSLIFPMSVVAMLSLYNPDNCYEEYCMYEFDDRYWEWICLDEESEDPLVFYIKTRQEKFK